MIWKAKLLIIQVQLPEGVTPFAHINQNDFSARKHKKLKEEDIAICECKHDSNDPDSACGESCLNVLTSTECTPRYCPCGDCCKNQRFQKSEYAKAKLFKTEERGWGLLADENIKAGQFIIEYCGEVISSEEANQRSQVYEAKGLKDAYIISLNANYFIDATKKGSLARFINHSCQPNCEMRKWTVLGELRVGIFAKQDIYTGTELAYDYNFEWYGGANVRCLCGAPKCSKFLGAKSPAFLEHNHVWEDGDDRYTVDKIPLYDSGEDEPLLKVLGNVKSFGPEFLASGQNDFCAAMDSSVGSKHQLELCNVVIEQLYSVPFEGMKVNSIKTELSEDKKLYSHAFPPKNAMISQIRRNSACWNFQIGLDSVWKKRSPHAANRKSKHGSGKQVGGTHAARLFASEEAQEEIIKCKQLQNQATSELNSVYNGIRPAIGEHDGDSQDNVDVSAACEWIGASSSKMKADFHFSVVKNAPPSSTPYGKHMR